MTEGESPKSRIEATEGRIDALLKGASVRKKRSIEHSLARPLKVEVLRMLYLVGCVIVDLVLLPSLLLSLFERPWGFVSLVLVIPVAAIELRLHRKWFPLPSDKGV